MAETTRLFTRAGHLCGEQAEIAQCPTSRESNPSRGGRKIPNGYALYDVIGNARNAAQGDVDIGAEGDGRRMKVGKVYCCDAFAGTLTQDSAGFTFRYDDAYFLNTAIHFPNDPSATALDFFADGHFTSRYEDLGFYSSADFIELGRCFGDGGRRLIAFGRGKGAISSAVQRPLEGACAIA